MGGVNTTIEFITDDVRATFGRLYPRAPAFTTCRHVFLTSGGKRWICTREKGHEGQHVAHNGDGAATAIAMRQR